MKNGFTIPEVALTIAITTILLSFILMNLFRAPSQAVVTDFVATLSSDLKSQQLHAMTLDTQGTGTESDYGVYFETNKYTLFRGSSYSAGNSSNFVINLDSGLNFSSITFPSSQLIFSKGSGEVSGFAPGSNTVTLINTQTGVQKIITVNKLGSISIQ